MSSHAVLSPLGFTTVIVTLASSALGGTTTVISLPFSDTETISVGIFPAYTRTPLLANPEPMMLTLPPRNGMVTGDIVAIDGNSRCF